jgi:bacillithiol system protein YtxJ
MAITDWSRTEELDGFLDAKGSGLVFKHSTRCPVSAEAEKELRRFIRDHPQVAAYRVLVIESRPVSNAIAEKLDVPHASPQAILVREGAPVWTGSHWEITAAALAAAWSV